MANESPFFTLGWVTLSTLDDARNSTLSGSTNNGKYGSAQFYWVYGSSVVGADRQIRLGSSLATITSTNAVLGILTNKPGPGEAADVIFCGVTKVIAGTTTITNGTPIMPSSAPTGQAGQVVAWAAGAMGPSIGMALETPTSTGALISAIINVTGPRST